VEILNFIFRLGVVFAIFGFLWLLINLGVSLLRGSSTKTTTETYILKFVRYFFLVDVTVLFCLDNESNFVSFNFIVIAGLILLMYFIGKLQNAQMRRSFFKFQGPAGAEALMQQLVPKFNVKAEALVIALSVITFVLLVLFPQYAANPISTWFYESIVDIEDTPVFGFIFKIIGFFFVMSIFIKLTNSLMALFTGEAMPNRQGDDSEDDDDHFDDYTEIK
jgi:hypothetical protein